MRNITSHFTNLFFNLSPEVFLIHVNPTLDGIQLYILWGQSKFLKK